MFISACILLLLFYQAAILVLYMHGWLKLRPFLAEQMLGLAVRKQNIKLYNMIIKPSRY